MSEGVVDILHYFSTIKNIPYASCNTRTLRMRVHFYLSLLDRVAHRVVRLFHNNN